MSNINLNFRYNENKPVTTSRDTQEIPPEIGFEMVRIIKEYPSDSSILDDFAYYEKKQEELVDYKNYNQANQNFNQNEYPKNQVSNPYHNNQYMQAGKPKMTIIQNPHHQQKNPINNQQMNQSKTDNQYKTKGVPNIHKDYNYETLMQMKAQVNKDEFIPRDYQNSIPLNISKNNQYQYNNITEQDQYSNDYQQFYQHSQQRYQSQNPKNFQHHKNQPPQKESDFIQNYNNFGKDFLNEEDQEDN